MLFEYLLLTISSFVGSFVTVSLGAGGGVFLLTVMAVILPPLAVIPVHGVIQAASNVGRTALLFRSVNFRYFWPFFIGSIIGITLGSQVVLTISESLFKPILAVFILLLVWVPKLWIKSIVQKIGGLFTVGIISSFLLLFVGSTGLFVVPLLQTLCKKHKVFVATAAVCMAGQHILKLVVFGILGFAFADYTLLMVLMVSAGFAGTWMGKHLVLKRITNESRIQAVFKAVITVLVFLMVVKIFL